VLSLLLCLFNSPRKGNSDEACRTPGGRAVELLPAPSCFSPRCLLHRIAAQPSVDAEIDVLYFRSTVKIASVRELRNHYSKLLSWIEAGEEIAISRRGRVVARLVPEKLSATGKVDWTESAAVRRNRSGERVLTAKQAATVLAESQGKW
jgi:antitoxin (DNA-binding transcriptional repressor) of toxin-antitoxin stability system